MQFWAFGSPDENATLMRLPRHIRGMSVKRVSGAQVTPYQAYMHWAYWAPAPPTSAAGRARWWERIMGTEGTFANHFGSVCWIRAVIAATFYFLCVSVVFGQTDTESAIYKMLMPHYMGLYYIPLADSNVDKNLAMIKEWASKAFDTSEFYGFEIAKLGEIPEGPLQEMSMANITVWTKRKEVWGIIILVQQHKSNIFQTWLRNQPLFLQKWLGGVSNWTTGYFKGAREAASDDCAKIGGEFLSSQPTTYWVNPRMTLTNPPDYEMDTSYEWNWAIAQMNAGCIGSGGRQFYRFWSLFRGARDSIIIITSNATTHSEAAEAAKTFEDMFTYFCDHATKPFCQLQ